MLNVFFVDRSWNCVAEIMFDMAHFCFLEVLGHINNSMNASHPFRDGMFPQYLVDPSMLDHWRKNSYFKNDELLNKILKLTYKNLFISAGHLIKICNG